MAKLLLICTFVELIVMALLGANSVAHAAEDRNEDDEVFQCVNAITCTSDSEVWIDKCVAYIDPEEFRRLMVLTNSSVAMEFRSAEGVTPEAYCSYNVEKKRKIFDDAAIVLIEVFSDVCNEELEESPICDQYKKVFDCAIVKLEEVSADGLCDL